MSKLYINENQIRLLKESMDELTYYRFISELKYQLREILAKPVSSTVTPFFKHFGFSKLKLIEYFKKMGLIMETKTVNQDTETPVVETTYEFVPKKLEKVQRMMWIKWFEGQSYLKESTSDENIVWDSPYGFYRNKEDDFSKNNGLNEISISKNDEHRFITINKLTVTEKGNGYGTKNIEKIINWANDHGYKIYVKIDPANEETTSFFGKFNFHTGKPYSDGSIKMIKLPEYYFNSITDENDNITFPTPINEYQYKEIFENKEKQDFRNFLKETAHYHEFLKPVENQLFSVVKEFVEEIVNSIEEGNKKRKFIKEFNFKTEYTDKVIISIGLYEVDDLKQLNNIRLYSGSFRNNNEKLINNKIGEPVFEFTLPIHNDVNYNVHGIESILSHEVTHLYDEYQSLKNTGKSFYKTKRHIDDRIINSTDGLKQGLLYVSYVSYKPERKAFIQMAYKEFEKVGLNEKNYKSKIKETIPYMIYKYIMNELIPFIKDYDESELLILTDNQPKDLLNKGIPLYSQDKYKTPSQYKDKLVNWCEYNAKQFIKKLGGIMMYYLTKLNDYSHLYECVWIPKSGFLKENIIDEYTSIRERLITEDLEYYHIDGSADEDEYTIGKEFVDVPVEQYKLEEGKRYNETELFNVYPVKKQLGKGADGMAFLMKDGRVLKLTSNKYEASMAQKLVGKNFKHLVRVDEVGSITEQQSDAQDNENRKKYGKFGGKYAEYYIVEEFIHIDKKLNKQFVDTYYKLIDEYVKTKEIPGYRNAYLDILGYFLYPEFIEFVEKHIADNGVYNAEDFKNIFNQLAEAVDELLSLKTPWVDFHKGNFGFRDDGSVVLIDNWFKGGYDHSLDESKTLTETRLYNIEDYPVAQGYTRLYHYTKSWETLLNIYNEGLKVNMGGTASKDTSGGSELWVSPVEMENPRNSIFFDISDEWLSDKENAQLRVDGTNHLIFKDIPSNMIKIFSAQNEFISHVLGIEGKWQIPVMKLLDSGQIDDKGMDVVDFVFYLINNRLSLEDVRKTYIGESVPLKSAINEELGIRTQLLPIARYVTNCIYEYSNVKELLSDEGYEEEGITDLDGSFHLGVNDSETDYIDDENLGFMADLIVEYHLAADHSLVQDSEAIVGDCVLYKNKLYRSQIFISTDIFEEYAKVVELVVHELKHCYDAMILLQNGKSPDLEDENILFRKIIDKKKDSPLRTIFYLTSETNELQTFTQQSYQEMFKNGGDYKKTTLYDKYQYLKRALDKTKTYTQEQWEQYMSYYPDNMTFEQSKKDFLNRINKYIPLYLKNLGRIQTLYNQNKDKNNISESVFQDIQQASKKTNTHPTEAQIEAENYAKGKVDINGYRIAIEQPKGSTRSGEDKDGKKWSIKMNNPYGYFVSYNGKYARLGYDKDKVDVFLGTAYNSTDVYVIDQYVDNKFDETKVMLLFNSIKDARSGYLSNYERGWKGLKYITKVTDKQFKEWLYNPNRQTKPFKEYAEELTLTEQHKVAVDNQKHKNRYINIACKAILCNEAVKNTDYKNQFLNHFNERIKTEKDSKKLFETIRELDEYKALNILRNRANNINTGEKVYHDAKSFCWENNLNIREVKNDTLKLVDKTIEKYRMEATRAFVDFLTEENHKLKTRRFDIPDTLYAELVKRYEKVKGIPYYTNMDGYKRLCYIISKKGKNLTYPFMKGWKHFWDHNKGMTIRGMEDPIVYLNGGRALMDFVNNTLSDARNGVKMSDKTASKNAQYVQTHYRDTSVKAASDPNQILNGKKKGLNEDLNAGIMNKQNSDFDMDSEGNQVTQRDSEYIDYDTAAETDAPDTNQEAVDMNDMLDKAQEFKVKQAVDIINTKQHDPYAKFQTIKSLIKGIDKTNLTNDMKMDLRNQMMETIVTDEDIDFIKENKIYTGVIKSLHEAYGQINNKDLIIDNIEKRIKDYFKFKTDETGLLYFNENERPDDDAKEGFKEKYHISSYTFRNTDSHTRSDMIHVVINKFEDWDEYEKELNKDIEINTNPIFYHQGMRYEGEQYINITVPGYEVNGNIFLQPYSIRDRLVHEIMHGFQTKFNRHKHTLEGYNNLTNTSTRGISLYKDDHNPEFYEWTKNIGYLLYFFSMDEFTANMNKVEVEMRNDNATLDDFYDKFVKTTVGNGYKKSIDIFYTLQNDTEIDWESIFNDFKTMTLNPFGKETKIMKSQDAQTFKYRLLKYISILKNKCNQQLEKAKIYITNNYKDKPEYDKSIVNNKHNDHITEMLEEIMKINNFPREKECIKFSFEDYFLLKEGKHKQYGGLKWLEEHPLEFTPEEEKYFKDHDAWNWDGGSPGLVHVSEGDKGERVYWATTHRCWNADTSKHNMIHKAKFIRSTD